MGAKLCLSVPVCRGALQRSDEVRTRGSGLHQEAEIASCLHHCHSHPDEFAQQVFRVDPTHRGPLSMLAAGADDALVGCPDPWLGEISRDAHFGCKQNPAGPSARMWLTSVRRQGCSWLRRRSHWCCFTSSFIQPPPERLGEEVRAHQREHSGDRDIAGDWKR